MLVNKSRIAIGLSSIIMVAVLYFFVPTTPQLIIWLLFLLGVFFTSTAFRNINNADRQPLLRQVSKNWFIRSGGLLFGLFVILVSADIAWPQIGQNYIYVSIIYILAFFTSVPLFIIGMLIVVVQCNFPQGPTASNQDK